MLPGIAVRGKNKARVVVHFIKMGVNQVENPNFAPS